MQFSTPYLILRQLFDDTFSTSGYLKRSLTFYINERSFAHPVGEIELGSIFDFVPDATSRIVKLQSIFEIPRFPTNRRFEKENYTASASLIDSYNLALLAQSYARHCIIEVGTSFGESSLTLALNSPSECIVHTLDIQPDNPTIGIKWRGLDIQSRIKLHFSSLKDVEKLFSPQSIDMIFVDGDHSYEGVLSDTLIAQKLVRKGGIICWHDYCFRCRDGVVKALDYIQSNTELSPKKIAHSNLTVAINR